MIPRATYRLQFHKGFRFADAAVLADYFQSLGISHVYASPILTARAGSTHGYNVIDFSRTNPELGGEDAFRDMAAALRACGIGIIVDTVPNHMAVGKDDNSWWLDVLKNGKSSIYATYFDIDWDMLGGKLLAPFLDGSAETLLANGDLQLLRDSLGAAFVYFDNRFPLRSEDEARLSSLEGMTLAEKSDLLARQHYILADWREADARINWRRFFDITELAALRMENSETFDAVHAKTLALFAEGLIDGLRIDHIDGLADPRAYCRKLRACLQEREEGRPPEMMNGSAFLIVEKILAPNESLPEDWLVDGTTGYDFMEEVSALVHDGAGDTLSHLWSRISGRREDFESEEYAARGEILARNFASQRDATARAMAAAGRAPTDVMSEGLVAVLMRLRCYRTYATGKGDTPPAGACFEAACESAEDAAPIARIVHSSDDGSLTVDAIRRFNQLSAPVAAKAVEDTAFYRYGRLLSRNDVGSDPRTPGISVENFHKRIVARAERFPRAMVTTATHDHKRGEDARARLAVLSEIPDVWRMQAETWLAAAPPSLDPGDVYQLLQTMVGAWPLEPIDADVFSMRLEVWSRKFLREAKLRSSWSSPDAQYEDGLAAFARELVHDETFRRGVDRFIAMITPAAIANSLAQIILRVTVPGTPDLYQGRERWDFSLVDPDNRAPVDYAVRKTLQADLPPLVSYPQSWRDGRQKQSLVSRLLNVRRAYPDIFMHGSYEPLSIRGRRDGHAIAFFRRSGPRCAIVAAALRCSGALVGHTEVVPPTDWWEDTELVSGPESARGLIDVLADARLGTMPRLVADLFESLPVAVLVSA